MKNVIESTVRYFVIALIILAFASEWNQVYGQTFYSFNGTSEHAVVTPTGTGILNDFSNPHDFTLEIRFRFNDTPDASIVSKHSSPADGFFMEVVEDSKISCGMGWNGAYERVISSPVEVATWYTLTFVYDHTDRTFWFYVNGELIGSETLPGSYYPETEFPIAIATSKNWGGASPIDVDYFRIWDVQRTTTEINSNKGVEVACDATHLLLQYKFDAPITSCTQVLEDCSPNGNDGIFYNEQCPNLLAVCKDTTVELTENELTIIASDVDGGSSGASGSIVTPSSFSCADLGPNSVTLTLWDETTNDSSSCMATVTVIESTALPAAWKIQNIGDQGAEGSSYSSNGPCAGGNNNNGPFTLSTGGYHLIPEDSDKLAFASVPLCGNGGIQARISDVSNGYAGLMIRESSMPGAKMVAVYFNLTNLLRREIRLTDNAPREEANQDAPFPEWLRIGRSGNLIKAFYRNSANGNWQLFHQAYLPMEDCVEMGMAVFTSVPGGQATAEFDKVRYLSQGEAN
ncbi:MAG: LamG domain-containing protein [bacterium]|nr:LamG domain-containing protein [bacterium]